MIYIEKIKMLPPCSYQGGKQRVSKEIIDNILSKFPIYENTKFYDLCCGSGAITIELINRGMNPKNIIMCDISSWGKVYKSIGEGSFDYNKFLYYANQIPRDKNKVQSFIINLAKEDALIDEEYKYILIQACSFGGKQIWKEGHEWKNTSFRDYWQPTEISKRRSPVNPIQPSIEELIKRVKTISEKLKGITCYNTDIHNMIPIIEKDTYNKAIYIDPPYINTTKYGFNFELNDFLSELFDATLSPIFVSEKEQISEDATLLNFNGAKGGISGNKKCKNEEWLNLFI